MKVISVLVMLLETLTSFLLHNTVCYMFNRSDCFLKATNLFHSCCE